MAVFKPPDVVIFPISLQILMSVLQGSIDATYKLCAKTHLAHIRVHALRLIMEMDLLVKVHKLG